MLVLSPVTTVPHVIEGIVLPDAITNPRVLGTNFKGDPWIFTRTGNENLGKPATCRLLEQP